MSAAKISAISIFNILDGEDEEDIQTKENSKMLKEGINGNIKFENISFQYEGRLNKVFEDLNFEIKNGEKVAFVGPSGCGKSTIIQLLLRFYFPEKGTITIGGTDIKDFDIHALRRKFGVVSQ
jgi:ATP-binding cassette subfamily B (MDR/TAP) protein 1